MRDIICTVTLLASAYSVREKITIDMPDLIRSITDVITAEPP